MNQKQLQKIQEMEHILNNMNQMLDEVELAFEKWKALRPEIKRLLKYYGSSTRFKDVEASNKGKIPSNIPHGVLSEDSVFDALTTEYSLAKEFQKLTKTVLKR